jgi:GNAT superfamily N-acetyltransferase
MKEILAEIVLESINSYIENNLDDFYKKSSEHSNFNSSGNDRVSWVFARKADWPDSIFRADFENYNMKREIKNIVNLIRKRRAPNGWTIGPLTKPINLSIELEKHGFSNVYHQAGMAVELNNLKKSEKLETDLHIKRVEDEHSLVEWSKVVSKIFNLKIDIDHLKFMRLQKEAHFYLAFFENKPVSTLLLYLSSGVAGLHAVSTLPEYRNRGFGFAISRLALNNAYKMGYKVGVLQASSLGVRVYRKLGFQKYCDINSYALLEDSKLKNTN